MAQPFSGPGRLFGAVITALLFTGLLGVGPVLMLRGGVRLVDRMSAESDGDEAR